MKCNWVIRCALEIVSELRFIASESVPSVLLSECVGHSSFPSALRTVAQISHVQNAIVAHVKISCSLVMAGCEFVLR